MQYLTYYKNKQIQEEILFAAKNREIAVKFSDRGFGRRPDVLQYRNDITEFAKQGATSFHCSEERWDNPLSISSKLRRKELMKHRTGWDLVLDIDGEGFEFSQIAADLLVKALYYHGLQAVSCKFSGNKGFHIGVPFEAFPKRIHNIPTVYWFPDGPRAIAEYLSNMIKEPLKKAILAKYTIQQLQEKTQKPFTSLIKKNELDPFTLLHIDTILISSRHLYRMPYSINEKSGLVSVPVDPEKTLQFKREDASIDKIKSMSDYRFLDATNVQENEARKLLIQAFDFVLPSKHEEKTVKKTMKQYTGEAVPVDLFPPCIKNLLKGMQDGRKRAVFLLVNFLASVGWDYDDIEALLKEWNEKNEEKLREVYMLGQIRYHKQQQKKMLPPNCSNKDYYVDLQVCAPEPLCKKIKNPVNFSLLRKKMLHSKKRKEKSKEAKNTKS